MGIKIGRGNPAPQLETKKSAKYGEQTIVATETPIVPEEPEVLDAPEEDVKDNTTLVVDENAVAPDISESIPSVLVDETEEKEKKETKKSKRGRKPKKTAK